MQSQVLRCASKLPAIFHIKLKSGPLSISQIAPTRRGEMLRCGRRMEFDGGHMANSAVARLRADDRVHVPTKVRADTRNTSAERRDPQRATPGFAHYKKHSLSATPIAFGACLAAAVVAGWVNRDEEYLVPDNGAGYWLGVVGATLMLLLLLYPLRKRVRFGKRMGSVAFWFRLHMALGVIGPALILLHSNFKIVSLNSNVAMIAMLTVAASGIVGRYLYGRIHFGLYGRKAVVREILVDAEALQHSLGKEVAGCDDLIAQMSAFAERAAKMPKGILATMGSLAVLAIRARLMRSHLKRQARRFLAAEAKRRGWSRRMRAQRFDAIAELVTLHIAAVRKAAAFELYDRLFGIWHVLHLPLFVILIFAASIHIVAAHFY